MTSKNNLKKRLLHQRLPSQDTHLLVLLTGARQTGKTTTVKMLYPEMAYYNLDAIEFRQYLSDIPTFEWGRTVGHAVLDEIQKEPSLLDKIKFAFDENQIRFSILLGSAQILLLKGIRETLAGRILVFEEWPFCLCELLPQGDEAIQRPLIHTLIQSDSIKDVLNSIPGILHPEIRSRALTAESHLLTWGGMPGLLNLEEGFRRDWLKSYNLTYLERDLSDLSRTRDLKPFRLFHQMTALRCAGLLSFSEISRDTGISIDIVRRYIEYLKLSYQIYLLPPYYRNLTSRLIKTPKIYWMDVGLWRQLTGITEPITGSVFENHVVIETIKYIRSQSLDANLFFYRTRSGLEVDLIIETERGIIGCEIKSRETVNKSDTTPLRKLAEASGDNWIGGIVIYRGQRIQEISRNIWAVPSWRLFS